MGTFTRDNVGQRKTDDYQPIYPSIHPEMEEILFEVLPEFERRTTDQSVGLTVVGCLVFQSWLVLSVNPKP